MLNIGWFSTGRGEGSRGLLRFVQDRIERNLLDARIGFVFSNRAPGEAEGSDEFFRLVNAYGIPLTTCSSAEFRRSRRSSGDGSGGRSGGRSRIPWAELRPGYDRLVLDALADYQPDICVLAGYMLITGGEMCRRYSMLNLHPALPDGPIGTWQEVIWTLIRERASRTGAMTHLATEEVDRGPVVSYCTAAITGPDFNPAWQDLDGRDLDTVRAARGEDFPLFQQIRRAEYLREPYLLFETLRAVAEGRVVVGEGQALNAAGQPPAATNPPGICLDAEIDRAMATDGVG